ncbi:MAG: hypothetical protein JW395_2961 [Nitrospira sp.]|nr:hypothetical protein [Nitrospira sp.]
MPSHADASKFGEMADGERFRDLARILPKGETVFDVGANRGQFAIEVLQAQELTVYCFEPGEDAFEQLSRVSRTDSGIIPVQVAVGEVTGTAKFFVQKSDVGSSLLALT